MYFCEYCGEGFDFPERTTDEFGEPAACCPWCKSEDFSEARYCKVCDELVKKENTVDGICEECQGRLQRDYRNLMLAEFKPVEIRYLEDHMTQSVLEGGAGNGTEDTLEETA